jgi:hypothetical protein
MVSHGSKKDRLPATQASADVKAEDYQISVHRAGHSVEIKLVFSSEYASMEFYDSLAQSVHSGSLQLVLRFARP